MNSATSGGPTLVVFHGGQAASSVEQLVLDAQRAATLDTVQRALDSGAFEHILVVTDSAMLGQQLPHGITRLQSTGEFHFGRTLRDLIRERALQRPFYVGGGSMPLLGASALADLARRLGQAEHSVVANNLFSADWVGFTPGQAIEAIDLPAVDNPLAMRLRDQAGLADASPPRTAATQFDIDTPSDLLVVQVHPDVGPNLHDYMANLTLDDSRLRAALRFLTDPRAEVLVAGRVGSHLWTYLEAETACRVRLFSEERGMRSDGRQERGEVRSLLGFYLEQVGARQFFRALAELGDAAFIDTRVIFHHLRLEVSTADRFHSDLGQVTAIEHPFVREFTQAAMEAPLPVILGGHSLVSGGLWATVDAAWRIEASCALPARVVK